MTKFNLGILTMTRTVNDTIADSEQFAIEIMAVLRRYTSCDWSDMCREDRTLNDSAVKSGLDRIVAAYGTSEGKIYIITEWNRSYTTIMFAEEY